MTKIGQFLLIVVVAAAVAFSVVYATGRKGEEAGGKVESVYDRVVRTNTLRCGYIVYPPSLLRDPNTGAFSGISYDIMTRLAQDLGLKVEWVEETGSGSMIENLKTGRFDLMCTSVWATPARGRAAEFSIPLYYTALNAYARADDPRFQDGMKAVNPADITISTIDGGLAAAIAREDYPQAKTYSMPELTDFSHLLLAVQDKHADITFSEEAQAAAFDKVNPGVLANITPEQPVRVLANAFLMKMGEDRFAVMLNNAIRNLHNNGFIEKAVAAYETAPRQYRLVMPGYQ